MPVSVTLGDIVVCVKHFSRRSTKYLYLQYAVQYRRSCYPLPIQLALSRCQLWRSMHTFKMGGNKTLSDGLLFVTIDQTRRYGPLGRPSSSSWGGFGLFWICWIEKSPPNPNTLPNKKKHNYFLKFGSSKDLSYWTTVTIPHHFRIQGSPLIRDLPSPQCQPNQTYCTAGEGLLTLCAGL